MTMATRPLSTRLRRPSAKLADAPAVTSTKRGRSKHVQDQANGAAKKARGAAAAAAAPNSDSDTGDRTATPEGAAPVPSAGARTQVNFTNPDSGAIGRAPIAEGPAAAPDSDSDLDDAALPSWLWCMLEGAEAAGVPGARTQLILDDSDSNADAMASGEISKAQLLVADQDAHDVLEAEEEEMVEVGDEDEEGFDRRDHAAAAALDLCRAADQDVAMEVEEEVQKEAESKAAMIEAAAALDLMLAGGNVATFQLTAEAKKKKRAAKAEQELRIRWITMKQKRTSKLKLSAERADALGKVA